MNHYYTFLLSILCINAEVWAFETETHALITRQAYANSVLAQTGEGSVVNRLGLDRLDLDNMPFHLYWQSDTSEYYYQDGGVSAFPEIVGKTPEYPERCQMQELRTPPTPQIFQDLFTNTIEPSGSDATLLPIQNWLVRGAIREDDLGNGSSLLYSLKLSCYSPFADYGDITRVYNHFYDPVQDQGLTTTLASGMKSVDWALGNIDSFATPPQVNDSRINHYSYADARNTFWWALTRQFSRQSGQPYTGSQREYDTEDRMRLWATTFRALGDVVHLLQDTAQPQHTRNDPHSTVDSGEQQAFEAFTNARVLGQTAEDQNSYVRSFFGSKLTDTLPAPSLGSYDTAMFSTPLKFFTSRLKQDTPDTSPNNRYGLADYTNRGFFTGGTLPGAENNGYSEPPSTLDEANGYTAVSNTECAKQFGLDARLSAVACTHYTRAVPDTVNPTYQDELPNSHIWPNVPLITV